MVPVCILRGRTVVRVLSARMSTYVGGQVWGRTCAWERQVCVCVYLICVGGAGGRGCVCVFVCVYSKRQDTWE